MSSATVITTDLILCPTNLEKIVRRCIPKEMIPFDYKFTNLSAISNLGLLRAMGKSTLGMFRSTEELFMLVANFLGVPGRANLMDFDLNGLYTTIPRMHTSLKGIDFVYKIDLLAFASLVVPCPFTNWQRNMVLSAIKGCQRFLESKWKSEIHSHCEMVQSPKDCLEWLSGQLAGVSDNYLTKAESLMKNFKPCSAVLQPHDLNVYWTEMLKLDGKGASVVYEILRTYNERHPITENKDDYIKMLSWIGIVARVLEDFMTNSIPSNTKATVRLFSAGKNNFVMAHEFLQSLKNKNFDVSGFEEEVLGMPKLSTLEFREVARKVNIQDMKNIEFIRITQPETKLQATPIPSPNGDYCVRAIDAFHELLNDMIVAKKVFQTIEKDQFKHVETFFDSVKEYFCSNQGVYFISLEDLNLIKSMWEECYEFKLKTSKQAKNIRNVRKGNSELDELRKVYLKLEKCLPNMKAIAGGEYLNKKPLDMYATIFQWQITALSDEITYITDFLHSQKVCTKWIPNSPCCGEGAELMEMVKKAYAEFQAEEDAKEAAKSAKGEKKNDEVAMEVPQKKKRSKRATAIRHSACALLYCTLTRYKFHLPAQPTSRKAVFVIVCSSHLASAQM
ncbi:hypothetical protein L5515_006353 [Caenorhabditis briggsae]|uniref:DUF7809 domain-containing protein n=1 Tax=Caenorhabditis briggsae TaxID=6238 RepID=A0AAE9F493_CAEBR|nr:hypothetical protein L5515_006353 [Caenorhabditis briggsae]